MFWSLEIAGFLTWLQYVLESFAQFDLEIWVQLLTGDLFDKLYLDVDH